MVSISLAVVSTPAFEYTIFLQKKKQIATTQFSNTFFPLDYEHCVYVRTSSQPARPTISQFWSFKICRTTLLSYIKFADLLILRWKTGWEPTHGAILVGKYLRIYLWLSLNLSEPICPFFHDWRLKKPLSTYFPLDHCLFSIKLHCLLKFPLSFLCFCSLMGRQTWGKRGPHRQVHNTSIGRIHFERQRKK